MEKIYLGIPYTFNPKLSFRIANEVAARLMKEGNTVFSPVSHSHPISMEFVELQLDHDFWMKQDLPILSSMNRMVVVVPMEHGGYNLVHNSKGLQREIKLAEDLFINIDFIEYYEKRTGGQVQ